MFVDESNNIYAAGCKVYEEYGVYANAALWKNWKFQTLEVPDFQYAVYPISVTASKGKTYMVGYNNSSLKPFYWIDGQVQNVDFGTKARLSHILVDNEDNIYIAGNVPDNSWGSIGKYWKNGIEQMSVNGMLPTSIALHNGDVYVCDRGGEIMKNGELEKHSGITMYDLVFHNGIMYATGCYADKDGRVRACLKIGDELIDLTGEESRDAYGRAMIIVKK